jgi:hypothetical protein
VSGKAARGSGAAAKSGAFDAPCAPWRSEGVGTKGIPTPALRAVDRASGGSNKGHDKEERLSGDACVRLDGSRARRQIWVGSYDPKHSHIVRAINQLQRAFVIDVMDRTIQL